MYDLHYSAEQGAHLGIRLAARGIHTLLGIFLVAISTCSLAQTTSESILIRNVTPLDARDGIKPVQDVLIRRGIIDQMGQGLNPPESARAIDGTGLFLSPGLWDMHIHLSYDPRLSASMGERFLDYGITSVRDTGGNLEILKPILKAMRAQGAQAPRVFFAGPLLDGEPVVYSGEGHAALGTGIRSVAAARAKVRALAETGVDFIKIYEMVSPEIFDALVDEAERHELPIAAHVPLSMLASAAGPRTQSLEHLRNIELDCAADAEALLKTRRAELAAGRNEPGMELRSQIHREQRDRAIANEDPLRCDRVLASLGNSIQVPTARLNAMTQYPPFERDDWLEALSDLPTAVQDEWRKAPQYMDPTSYRAQGEWTLKMIARLAAQHIDIGAGTDTPIGWAIPGYSLHNELSILVSAGLSPRTALAAATTVPAAFFQLTGSLGRVAPGYQADLLLLGANPLEDIENTRQIRAVFSRGELVRETPGTALPAR
jgi:imidazolonepropionase-like amidohydrolase